MIFINILMILGKKEKYKSTILTHTIGLFLTIATNIPVLLMPGFVFQGHIF